MVKEVKWRGVPVWSHAGILCTGEAYKDKLKRTFAQGARLSDPAGLFNVSLEGNTRRAIDLSSWSFTTQALRGSSRASHRPGVEQAHAQADEQRAGGALEPGGQG